VPIGFMELYVERGGEVLGPFDVFVGSLKENVLRNIRIEPKIEPEESKKSLTGTRRCAIYTLEY